MKQNASSFLVILLFLQSTGYAFGENAPEESDSHRDKTIQTMKATYEAVTARKKPYKVRGLYESHRAVDGKATKTYQIEFSATVNHDQYRYDFEFAALPPSNRKPYDQIIAMSDGESLYVSRFTPRINPHGCEADVYKSGSLFIATRSFRAAYHDIKSFLIPPTIFDEYEIETTETKTGDLECTYPLDKINRVKFVLSKKQGFNLVSVKFFVTGEDQPRQEQRLSWKRHDDHWYLSNYQDSIYRADRSLITSYHFKITDFEWADAADLQATSMSAVEMAVKGRVLDRRRDGDEKIFEFVTNGLPDESRKE